MTVQRPKYDFEDIHMMVERDYKWEDIANKYQRGLSTVYEWYHRHLKKRKQGIQKTLVTSPKYNTKPTTKTRNKTNIRRAKYGSLPPTGYREDIKDIDHLVKWIQKYTPYMSGKWNNTATRKTAQLLFFDVFKSAKNGMRGAPRDSGKSKVSVAVYAAIAANYYLPQSVIINGTKAKKRIFNGLWKIFRYSTEFRKDYGDIITEKNRIEGYLEIDIELAQSYFNEIGYVSDDPTIQISVYNGIIGAHPYIVWLEDILQSEFKNEESNEYMLYEVYDAIIDKLSTRKGGTFTRKGMEDLYSHMPSRSIRLVVDSAIQSKNDVWPDVSCLIYDDSGAITDIDLSDYDLNNYTIIERPGWTVKSLLLMRTRSLLDKKAFEMFEREMQNNPILSEGAYFEKDKWIVVDGLDFDRYIRGKCYIAIDPAYGKSSHADYFAVVVGVIHGQRLHIVKTELLKGVTLSEAVDLIHFYDKNYRPRTIILETDFQQVWLAQSVGRLPALSEVKSESDKTQRIDALSLPFNRELIRICSDMGYIDEAYRQYVEYDRMPSTGTKKDDWLDATARLYEYCKYYLYGGGWSAKSWTKEKV